MDNASRTSNGMFPTIIVGGTVTLLVAFLVMIVVVVPSDLQQFVGMCFIIFGGLNLAFHRRFGSQVFSSGSGVSQFWDRVGEVGSQRLYLAVGALLLLFGVLLVTLSASHATTPPNLPLEPATSVRGE